MSPVVAGCLILSLMLLRALLRTDRPRPITVEGVSRETLRHINYQGGKRGFRQ